MKWLKRLATLFLLTVIFTIIWTAWLYLSAPVDTLRGIVTYTPPYKTYTRQAGLAAPDNFALKDMPVDLMLSTMTAEDQEFPDHIGVRPMAIWGNIKEHWDKGLGMSSNSTLTQQLVKNVFTGPKVSLYRKYVELIYALKMERHFTKDEIFILYANIAQIGPDSFGYRQAAKDYFNKNMLELTPVESAFIVNNLPSPKGRTAWFREGTDDPTVIHRTASLLYRTTLLKTQYVAWDQITDEQKSHFFTQYMKEQSRMVCVADDTNNAFWPWAEETARNFVQAHKKPTPILAAH